VSVIYLYPELAAFCPRLADKYFMQFQKVQYQEELNSWYQCLEISYRAVIMNCTSFTL